MPPGRSRTCDTRFRNQDKQRQGTSLRQGVSGGWLASRNSSRNTVRPGVAAPVRTCDTRFRKRARGLAGSRSGTRNPRTLRPPARFAWLHREPQRAAACCVRVAPVPRAVGWSVRRATAPCPGRCWTPDPLRDTVVAGNGGVLGGARSARHLHQRRREDRQPGRPRRLHRGRQGLELPRFDVGPSERGTRGRRTRLATSSLASSGRPIRGRAGRTSGPCRSRSWAARRTRPRRGP